MIKMMMMVMVKVKMMTIVVRVIQMTRKIDKNLNWRILIKII